MVKCRTQITVNCDFIFKDLKKKYLRESARRRGGRGGEEGDGQGERDKQTPC